MVLTVSTRLSVPIVCVIWIITGNGLVPVSLQAQSYKQCNFALSVNASLTLEQAVFFNSSNHSERCACVRIEIPTGRHTLTTQTLFSSEVEMIEFIGVGNDVYVSCAYDVRDNYTWYFHNQSSVTIGYIHFENCPRPLRLDTISNVTIQNCSFR